MCAAVCVLLPPHNVLTDIRLPMTDFYLVFFTLACCER